jgi:hypothetical protein
LETRLAVTSPKPSRRGGDTHNRLAIDAMIQRLGLDWGARRLGVLRFDAQRLVQQLRPRIRAVAAKLIEHRRLSASAIAGYARY